MTPEIDKLETDHEMRARLGGSLAGQRDIDNYEDFGASPWQLRLAPFAIESHERRSINFCEPVAFIAPPFDELDKFAGESLSVVPLTTAECSVPDGGRILERLERMRPLSREQRDYVTCQRAREAVRVMARENREGHARFQELLGVADDFVTELEKNPTLRIRLNPIRVWRVFETRDLLGESSETPAEVLFYPVANSTRAAVLKPVALERIQPLCRFGSCTVSEWLYEFDRLAGSHKPDRAALIALSRELMKYSLIAFA